MHYSDAEKRDVRRIRRVRFYTPRGGAGIKEIPSTNEKYVSIKARIRNYLHRIVIRINLCKVKDQATTG